MERIYHDEEQFFAFFFKYIIVPSVTCYLSFSCEKLYLNCIHLEKHAITDFLYFVSIVSNNYGKTRLEAVQ